MNSNVGLLSLVSPLGPVSVTAGPCVSTVNERLAAAPVFPAPSVATTWKVCAPSASGSGASYGDTHAAMALSSEHSKLAPSSELNSKRGVVSFVSPPGPASVTTGACVSTVKTRLAASPVFPAASLPLTWNVYSPSASASCAT